MSDADCLRVPVSDWFNQRDLNRKDRVQGVGAVTGRCLGTSHLSRWSASGQRGGGHLE